MIALWIAQRTGGFSPVRFARVAGHDFAVYVPACFAVEEVTFRGCLSNYVNRPDEPFSWWAAVAVSCLWGWWHMGVPNLHPHTVAQFVRAALIFPLPHLVVGVWLSRYQWQSRSLLPGSVTHAFIDAVRNAFNAVAGA